jgi:hypothetical protein
MPELFPTGAVLLSIDTEHMWGYSDHLTEAAFHQRFPRAVEGQQRMLAHLVGADISATWFVVGGMALQDCAGGHDLRFAGLPDYWVRRVPRSRESADSLWCQPSFVRSLLHVTPSQEIGLHGGLTHLPWQDPHVSREHAERELAEGVRSLEELGVRPESFSFARTQEAFHTLLPQHGLHSFRGRVPALAWKLGRTLPGAFLRALDEWCATDPPIVWPREVMPGLWNVPASMFFYPIRPAHRNPAPIRSRVQRFVKGVAGAVRSQAIFHFSLHPENLVESPQAFSVFDEILDRLSRARREEGVEVLTMSEVARRMERSLLCSTTKVTPATI